jgi:hypothetical protein
MSELINKINRLIAEATEAYDEAEKAREDSSYTDIDALEQSCYNDGFRTALNTVLSLLQESDDE